MGSYTRRIVILAISGLGFGCSSMTAELVSMRSEETNVRDYSHYNPASISYFLPMSIVSITVRRDSAGVHFIDDPMLRKVPDGRFLYRTNLHLSAFSSDDIAITTSASGFLATVTTTLDDKTGDVVKYIASSIITLLTGVPGDKVALVGTRAFEATAPIVFKASFNPTDENQRRRLNEELRRQFGLEIRLEPLLGNDASTASSTSGSIPAPGASAPVGSADGILYRPALPYLLTVLYNNDVQSQHVITVENEAPLLNIPIQRTAFVKRVNTIILTDGVPTSVTFNKPSEALAVVSIPYDIFNAFLRALSQIVPLATTGVNNDQALLDARAKYLTTLMQYEAARQKYEDSQGGSSSDERAADGTRSNSGGSIADPGDQAPFD
jgi:hypothetical protein